MPAVVVGSVLAALVVVCAGWYVVRYIVRLRRALVSERAAALVAGRIQARDLDAFRVLVNQLFQERAVLAEAERVLDSALAAHRTEGGHP